MHHLIPTEQVSVSRLPLQEELVQVSDKYEVQTTVFPILFQLASTMTNQYHKKTSSYLTRALTTLAKKEKLATF